MLTLVRSSFYNVSIQTAGAVASSWNSPKDRIRDIESGIALGRLYIDLAGFVGLASGSCKARIEK